MTPTGVVHGRFQVLHNDHLAYLLSAKARCGHLIVGITNPDPRLTARDDADRRRSDPRANPLTYFERYTLVRAVLEEAGVDAHALSVVPLPINFPELHAHYVPPEAVYYLSIYDDWGRRKRELFERLGRTVEILSERSIGEKGISATDVRRRLASGEAWKHLVPPATARLMEAWCIAERLRRMEEMTS